MHILPPSEHAAIFMYVYDTIPFHLNSVRCKNTDDMEVDSDVEGSAMRAYSYSSTHTGIPQMITMGTVCSNPYNYKKKHLSKNRAGHHASAVVELYVAITQICKHVHIMQLGLLSKWLKVTCPYEPPHNIIMGIYNVLTYPA